MSAMYLEILSLCPGAALAEEAQGYALADRRVRCHLGPLSTGLRAAFAALSEGGCTEDALLDIVEAADGFMAVPHFSVLLDHVATYGFLRRTLCYEGRKLVEIVAGAAASTSPGAGIDLEDWLVLSRHALLRNNDGEMIAESPLASHTIVIHDPSIVGLLATASRPCPVRELLSRLPGFARETGTRVLEILRAAEILTLTPPDDVRGVDPALMWEHHDLYFHSRSRSGRHANPYGATYRFATISEQPPVFKPPMSEETVPLSVPDLDRLIRSDRPFTAVLEDRRSIWQHGDPPMTCAELGEFLYRAARHRRLIHTDYGAVSNRPYPSGGALYELEIYPIVARCDGLAPGLYQYLSENHRLCKIAPWTKEAEQLIDSARAAMQHCKPQVLFVLTARFPRVSWKYESMVYALTLKNVGVLFQTFYLVGTAMELAPCAIGGGNSALFARATGLEWLKEDAVGEFALGSRAHSGGNSR